MFFISLLAGCGSRTDKRNDQGQANQVMVTKGNSSIIVTAGAQDLNGMPVAVEWDEAIPACMESSGVVTPAQEQQTEDGGSLLWILAEASAGEIWVYVPSEQTDCPSSTFLWEEVGSDRSRLLIDGLPAIEYVYPEFDSSRAEQTMKPFHHVYAPDGSQLITKGVGGRYSHHRGIFYGYRNIRYNGDTLSTWGSGGRTEHVRIVQEWAGPVFGGHELVIEWKDEEGENFAEEVRKVRVYRRPGGELLIDVKSVLTSLVGPVELDGDPQHGGLQFRVAQYVADHLEQSRYLRTEEWSDYPPDEELNDTEQRLDDPWNAFQFVVEGEPYTVGYFSHPQNPPGGLMSERLYGRFGEFIPGLVIDEGEPLTLRYRFLITSGHELDRDRMEREYAVYAMSP